MKEALFYKKLEDKKVSCFLCHQFCVIEDGKRGFCGVRENRKGILYSLVYGKAIAQNVDPIEKKPLFHFYPGSASFSISTIGCNFRCLHCQNADISQPLKEEVGLGRDVSPEEIVGTALAYGCQSISYTYTEPTIFFEYALDIAKLAKEKGLKNNFVTNGYMSTQALETIRPFLDAANVDLKSFSDDFYKKVCAAKVKPVLENLKLMVKYGIWVEVTTLIIPTLNDDEENLKEIARFISTEMGKDVPWHVTAFYPTYKLAGLPSTGTPILERAVEIGHKNGLRYVYTGNVPTTKYQHTYCFKCNEPLIKRWGYNIEKNLLKDGKCPKCGAVISGKWI
ncbi:MAG: AmmeMemoRadiSam system radical SAM enzyme [Candidatus Omnitrophota bacterium]